MPEFKYNPADVSAGFPVYPADTYHITLGEPKTFYFTGKENKADNYGVQFFSKISSDGKFNGKKFAVKAFMHTDDSKSMTKVFQMAALGFDKKQEEEFDSQFGSADWSFNTDTNRVGEAWKEMKGKVVEYDLAVKMGESGEEQQQIKGVRPFRG